MEVLRICAALGGTVSGEHGIGVEKLEAMRYVFSENDLRVPAAGEGRVRPQKDCAIPGKVLPGQVR